MGFKAAMQRAFAADSPGWGIILGVWLAIGDILLTPPDEGEFIGFVGFSRLTMLLAGMFLMLAWTVLSLAQWSGRGAKITYGLAGLVTVLVVTIGGALTSSIYTSEDVPIWRFILLPCLALLAAGLGFLIRGHPVRSRRLLLTAIVAIGLVGYAQEDPLTWSLLAGLGLTYLWLVLPIPSFDAFTGLTMHALALLAVLQAEPDWFLWTPFPFLTFFPIYVLALFLRSEDTTQRGAWWVGVVIAGGSILLGTSTLIGNLRRDLPWWEPAIMLVGGLVFGVLYWLMRYRIARPAPIPEA